MVKKVSCAINCGVVVNPDAAVNMTKGAIVGGIGTALFGQMTFTEGVPDQNNFSKYRMIRVNEAPKRSTYILFKITSTRRVWVNLLILLFLPLWQTHCIKPPGSVYTVSRIFQPLQNEKSTRAGNTNGWPGMMPFGLLL